MRRLIPFRDPLSHLQFNRKDKIMTMLRFEPFRGLDTVKRRMFDTINDINTDINDFSPKVDIAHEEKAITLLIEIPGVSKEDVKISIDEHRVLTISGEKKQHQTIDRQAFLRSERRFGSFTRLFKMTDLIDIQGIQAEFNNGVLSVTLPKIEQEQPKSIEVKIA
ncbi:MAG: Hsp20/alpha crystallin family protein [Ignavibacteria bacterium]|nr:Hsp20/alpha crystallin family protein [Ignavibacteria bacterium]